MLITHMSHTGRRFVAVSIARCGVSVKKAQISILSNLIADFFLHTTLLSTPIVLEVYIIHDRKPTVADMIQVLL